jgi:hypothetical protein
MQVVKAIALQKQHESFRGSTPFLPAKIKNGSAHCQRLAALKPVKSGESRRAGWIPVTSSKFFFNYLMEVKTGVGLVAVLKTDGAICMGIVLSDFRLIFD